MSDTRTFLEGIFSGQIPVIRKNSQTGAREEIYYNYDDDKEELVQINRPPVYGSRNDPPSQEADLWPAWEQINNPLQMGLLPLLDVYLEKQIEKEKEQHYNRQRFVHPDLRQGNGRQILDHELDQWECENDAIAHNLNGENGNMDCRGKVGTPREHQQMIVAPNGMIVTSPENIGTYDFVPPTGFINGVGHFGVDVFPWIIWGNSEKDSTTRDERIDALERGIRKRYKKFRKQINL